MVTGPYMREETVSFWDQLWEHNEGIKIDCRNCVYIQGPACCCRDNDTVRRQSEYQAQPTENKCHDSRSENRNQTVIQDYFCHTVRDYL